MQFITNVWRALMSLAVGVRWAYLSPTGLGQLFGTGVLASNWYVVIGARVNGGKSIMSLAACAEYINNNWRITPFWRKRPMLVYVSNEMRLPWILKNLYVFLTDNSAADAREDDVVEMAEHIHKWIQRRGWAGIQIVSGLGASATDLCAVLDECRSKFDQIGAVFLDINIQDNSTDPNPHKILRNYCAGHNIFCVVTNGLQPVPRDMRPEPTPAGASGFLNEVMAGRIRFIGDAFVRKSANAYIACTMYWPQESDDCYLALRASTVHQTQEASAIELRGVLEYRGVLRYNNPITI